MQSEAALVDGVIRDEDGCLYLVTDAETTPVVWPSGSSWRPSPPTVVLPSAGDASLGSHVSSAGGCYTKDVDLSGLLSAFTVEAAWGCAGAAGADEIAVLTTDHDMVVRGPS